jgi:hypothetical protein
MNSLQMDGQLHLRSKKSIFGCLLVFVVFLNLCQSSFHQMLYVLWSFWLLVLSSLDTKHVDLCFLNDQKNSFNCHWKFLSHSHGDLIDTFFFSSFTAIEKKIWRKKRKMKIVLFFFLAIASFNHVRFHTRLHIYINIFINNNNSRIHSYKDM